MKNLLLLLLFTGSFTIAYSCSVNITSFCHSSAQQQEDLIISGTITSVDDDGIDFEIIDVIRGTESRNVIRIWDGTDFDCNGIFSMAASDLGILGDSLILMLPKINSLENTWDVFGDYRRPNYFGPTPKLKYSNHTVSGFIKGLGFDTSTITSISYIEFIETWKNNNNCDDIILSDKTPIIPENAIMFNNPVSSSFDIDFLNENGEKKAIFVYSAHGQLVHQQQSIYSDVSIDFTVLKNGLYIVRIEENGKLPFIVKVVKT